MLDVARVLHDLGQDGYVVPRPHPELVTQRVLVMERFTGFNFDDVAGMQGAGIDTEAVIRTGMIAFMEGAMIHGVFHGDLHGGNLDRYVVSLARTLSKFRALGLSLEDVVYAATAAPAAALGLPGFGRIEAGAPAHLTVFDEQSTDLEVEDAEGERRRLPGFITPSLTLVHGNVHEVTEAL